MQHTRPLSFFMQQGRMHGPCVPIDRQWRRARSDVVRAVRTSRLNGAFRVMRPVCARGAVRAWDFARKGEGDQGS